MVYNGIYPREGNYTCAAMHGADSHGRAQPWNQPKKYDHETECMQSTREQQWCWFQHPPYPLMARAGQTLTHGQLSVTQVVYGGHYGSTVVPGSRLSAWLISSWLHVAYVSN